MPDSAKPEQATRIPLALALRYEPGHAPRLVAKGRGSVAEAIIGKARENGLAIEEDPVLAEALASVELDTEIPSSLFVAVAEVIAFVLAARSPQTGGGGQ
jgi:flagellar biosynthesis protein